VLPAKPNGRNCSWSEEELVDIALVHVAADYASRRGGLLMPRELSRVSGVSGVLSIG